VSAEASSEKSEKQVEDPAKPAVHDSTPEGNKAKADAPAADAAKEPAATTPAAEKKPLFGLPSAGGTSAGFGGFGGFGAFGGFGSAGSFASSGASGSAFGGAPLQTFGSFGSAPSFSFSFSNAQQQADAFKTVKKREDGEDGGGEDGEGEGGGEDNEKEVPVEKTCQLEEVETCTGEEDEQNVLQVR
jgi:hypothetical protein